MITLDKAPRTDAPKLLKGTRLTIRQAGVRNKAVEVTVPIASLFDGPTKLLTKWVNDGLDPQYVQMVKLTEVADQPFKSEEGFFVYVWKDERHDIVSNSADLGKALAIRKKLQAEEFV